MKTLLIILCIIFAVKFWPYIIAFPFAVVKALYYIVTGRDNDPDGIQQLHPAQRSRFKIGVETDLGKGGTVCQNQNQEDNRPSQYFFSISSSLSSM